MNKYIAATFICASVISHTAFATSPPAPIQQQKQIAGYYQYQTGDVQITALLDGTNFMSPTLFKNLPEKEVHDILKKYYADQAKGIQTAIH